MQSIRLRVGRSLFGPAFAIGLLSFACWGQETPTPASPTRRPRPTTPATPVPRSSTSTIAPPVSPASNVVVVAAPMDLPVRSPKNFDDLRDPFWPVGQVVESEVSSGRTNSPESAVQISEAEWRKMELLLRQDCKGATRLPAKNGKPETLALINGSFFPVGATVSLPGNGRTYRWIVVSITLNGGPVFERVVPAPVAPATKK